MVALLPEFLNESANTIRFLGASGSTPPPVSSKSVDELTEEEKRLVDLLSVTNNVILDGVPGTGKTYIAKRISKLVAENTRGHAQEFAITLHPSTSYEDFVEGLRPNQNGVETRNVNPIRVLIDHPSDDKLRMLVTLDASETTSWSPCTLEEVENGLSSSNRYQHLRKKPTANRHQHLRKKPTANRHLPYLRSRNSPSMMLPPSPLLRH